MNDASFKAHFGKYTKIDQFHFAALNTALFNDGLFIEVKKNAVVKKPVHIIHLLSSAGNIFIQPRFLFVLGSNAEVSIVESFVTADDCAAVFVNNVAEIVLDENAHMQHYYVQTGTEQTRMVQQTDVSQQASSVYNNYKASFPGAALLRNNFNVALNAENIESHLWGLYLAGGKQVVDNHTIVDHRKPHCQSNELYKGVMKDEAIAVFNGKIFCEKGCAENKCFSTEQ